jgi:hypothetical protein
MWTAIVAAALSVAVSGCAARSGANPVQMDTPVPVVPGAVPTPDHVLLVVFENKNAQSVLDTPAAPYLTSLARSGANFTDAHGVTHPSQPNYVALFSGATKGLTDDSCPESLTGENLAGQLLAAGKTFVGYSEDLPRAGATDCKAGEYRRKHNPWVDFADLPADINQPYTALPTDYAELPTVSFVVPDLCHDMHNCDVATGDQWAREHLAPYVAWAGTHNSLLVVTFDESEGGSADNHIATFLVGPMVHAGNRSQQIDHYSVLRTIEEMYGLAPLGQAGNRPPISGVWVRPPG